MLKFDLDLVWRQSIWFWKDDDLYSNVAEISKFLGTMLGTIDSMKTHSNFVKIEIFGNFCHVKIERWRPIQTDFKGTLEWKFGSRIFFFLSENMIAMHLSKGKANVAKCLKITWANFEVLVDSGDTVFHFP